MTEVCSDLLPVAAAERVQAGAAVPGDGAGLHLRLARGPHPHRQAQGQAAAAAQVRGVNMTASSPHTILRRRDQFVSELEAGDQGTDGASSQVRVADNSMLMKFQREIIGFSLKSLVPKNQSFVCVRCDVV